MSSDGGRCSHMEGEVEGRTDNSRLLQGQLGLDVVARRMRFPVDVEESVSQLSPHSTIVYSPPAVGWETVKPREEKICFVTQGVIDFIGIVSRVRLLTITVDRRR